MTSQRHGAGTAPRPAEGDRDEPADLEPVLAAARRCVLDVGLRRTTLADVARRAGVSRMTVYRQYGDLPSLVSALLTRELLAVIEQARRAAANQPTARQRLVEATVRTVVEVTAHPLYRRVLDVDPELLLPLVVDRFGSTQQAAVDLLADLVAEGHRDGSIRPVEPRRAAVCLQLTAQSFVFSARVVRDLPMTEELRHLLERYLQP